MVMGLHAFGRSRGRRGKAEAVIVRPKHQRLILLSLALVALLGAVLLAMWGLRDRAAYFVTPSDIAAGTTAPDRAMRLGGMVEKGSLKRDADGLTMRFTVSDGRETTPVVYRGIAPDLFREGSGVIAEGKLNPGGLFVADAILAKHDERYMPPQMPDRAGRK
jgi:cytochrome c-type biogenesis protein CcmE